MVILQTNSVRNLSHCQPGLMASLHHTDCGTLVIIYWSHEQGTFGRNCSISHMTSWDTSELPNCTQHCVILITGQIWEETLRRLTFACVLTASTTNHQLGNPLHVLDNWGDSVAMYFIGPLPLDNGFDCILSMTDRLCSEVHVIPTHTKIMAEELTLLFFNHWYCENGLWKDIVSDHHKPFL